MAIIVENDHTGLQANNIVSHLESVDAPTFDQVITDLAEDDILRARMKKALGVPE